MKTINVSMKVRGYDEIVKMELYEDIAPITVKNFVSLIEKKFYDGLTFHRVIQNFVVQGGDPAGNGTGGSANKIKGEFTSNGVVNNLKHTRGVLSMARSAIKDSASSQFFIVLKDTTSLDGEYAAFGKVTDGMDVIDKIAMCPVSFDDAPRKPQIIEKITIDK